VGKKSTGLLMGAFTLFLIILVYPYVGPAISDLADVAIDLTGITEGIPFMIFDTMEYWLIPVAIAGAVWGMVVAGRSRGGA